MTRKKVLLIIMLVLLFIGFCNVIYARYVLTMNLGVKSSSKNFFFDVKLNSSLVEYKDGKAEIDLTIKNNDGLSYDTFNTLYEISVLNNNKFDYTIGNVVNNSILKTIDGNALKEEKIKIILNEKDNVELNLTESINVNAKAKMPYVKDFNFTITIDVEDIVSPIVSISANETAWTNKDVILTATFQDNETGVVGYAWSDSNLVPSSWTKITATTSMQKQTLTIGSNVTKYFWAIDEDGNTNYASIVVDNIDKVPPSKPTISIRDISVTASRWVYTISSTTSSDTASKVKGYEFVLGSTSSFLSTNTNTITGTNNPNYTIKVRAQDYAGNYSEYSNVMVLNIERLFIRQLYQELRGNGGGAEEEIDGWETSNVAVSAAELALGIFDSPESRETYTNVGKEEMTKRLYRGILGREADSSGLQNFMNYMTSADWYDFNEKVVKAIANSAEAQAIFSARGLITGVID